MDDNVQDMIQVGSMTYRAVKGIVDIIKKIYNNAYYGQWYGKADFQKLHKIAGSHIGYLEINTQNNQKLKEILSNTLDKYKVLYSPMPDLNATDGRSQIAFNADQSEAVRTALNQYNLEKMQALNDAKEKYGVGTEAYQKAKSKIEAAYPEIRSISAEDYVLTRLDENGRETTEYKALEASAKENMRKEEAALKKAGELPAATEPFEDKVIRFADSQKKADYASLLKQGKAQRVSVAEFKTEYVPIAGRNVPIYHAPLDEKSSVVLTKNSLIDDKTAVLINDKKYKVVTIGKKALDEMTGSAVATKIAKESLKRAQQLAKLAAKTAAKTNPYTAIAEKAIEITKDTIGAVPNAQKTFIDGEKKKR